MAAGEEKLKLVLSAIDKTAAPIRALNRRIEGILAPVRKVRNAMRTLADESGLTKLGHSFAKLTSLAKGLAVTGLAASAGLLEFVRRTAESTDSLAEMTRQIGIGIERYQDLQFAAMSAGVGTEAFAGSMRTLAKNVGLLKLGTGPLAKHLGPGLAKSLKSTRGTGEALELILGSLRKITDPLKRNAIAAKVFGKSGQSMALMAELSSEALANLVKESEGFGRISKSNSDDAETWMDAFDRLKVVAGRLGSQLAAELYPDLTKATNQLIAFIREHRVEVINGAAEAVRQLGSGLRTMGEILSTNLPKLQSTIEGLGGLETVLKGIAAIALAPVARTAIALAMAIGATGTAVLATGAALAYLLVQFEKLTGIKGKILDVIDPFATPRAPAVSLRPPARPALVEGAASASRGRFDLVGDVNIRLDQRGARVVSTSSSIPTVGFAFSRGAALSPQ